MNLQKRFGVSRDVYIASPIANQIEDELKEKNYKRVLELLLEYYYDPRYYHATSRYPEDQKVNLKAGSTEEACEEVKKFIKGCVSIHETSVYKDRAGKTFYRKGLTVWCTTWFMI
ncbi:hypothetical protein ACIGEL_07980 [Rossellomorea aquimaris]|uniref:hypothetical protein n=1 Tax=Rossellomorea aquimaris TaxID=189382 RepID=UPI0037CA280B